MTKSLISLFFILFLVLHIFSCQNQSTYNYNNQSTPILTKQEPNNNYTIRIPEGWTFLDTIMQDNLKVRLLFPPQDLLSDCPVANIFIASMEGQNIQDFTTKNINYLKDNMNGVIILERGYIDSSIEKGQWFTYTKDQNGISRDLINYIIPHNGYAYMITCGSKKGSMLKYKTIFDNIAKTLKIN